MARKKGGVFTSPGGRPAPSSAPKTKGPTGGKVTTGTSGGRPALTGTANAMTRGKGKKVGLKKQAAAEAYVEKRAKQYKKATAKRAARPSPLKRRAR